MLFCSALYPNDGTTWLEFSASFSHGHKLRGGVRKQSISCSLKLFRFSFCPQKHAFLENLRKIFLFPGRDILKEKTACFAEGRFLRRAVFHVANIDVGIYSRVFASFFALAGCTGSVSGVYASKIKSRWRGTGDRPK